jgi:uncharacterized integral membrane protein
MAGPEATPKSPWKRWRIGDPVLTRVIVGAVALIYGIIFIALNRGRVRIHFLFFTVNSRVWVGFLVCLALGALLGRALAMYRQRHSRPAHSREHDGAE